MERLLPAEGEGRGRRVLAVAMAMGGGRRRLPWGEPLSPAAASFPPVPAIATASTSGRLEWGFWGELGLRGCSDRPWLPTGGLFLVQKAAEDERAVSDIGPGELWEATCDKGRHSVSTSLERAAWEDERTLSVASTHEVDRAQRHSVSSAYTNDLKGMDTFNLQTTHKLTAERALQTSLQVGSMEDPTVEVELKSDLPSWKLSKSFTRNLQAGTSSMKLHGRRTALSGGAELAHTLTSDFRGNNSLLVEASAPLFGLCTLSPSFLSDLKGKQGVKVKAEHKRGDKKLLGASLASDFLQLQRFGVEARKVLTADHDVEVKLGCLPVDKWSLSVAASSSHPRRKWSCAVSHEAPDSTSVRLDWKCQFAPKHLYKVKVSAKLGGPVKALLQLQIPIV